MKILILFLSHSFAAEMFLKTKFPIYNAFMKPADIVKLACTQKEIGKLANPSNFEVQEALKHSDITIIKHSSTGNVEFRNNITKKEIVKSSDDSEKLKKFLEKKRLLDYHFVVDEEANMLISQHKRGQEVDVHYTAGYSLQHMSNVKHNLQIYFDAFGDFENKEFAFNKIPDEFPLQIYFQREQNRNWAGHMFAFACEDDESTSYRKDSEAVIHNYMITGEWTISSLQQLKMILRNTKNDLDEIDDYGDTILTTAIRFEEFEIHMDENELVNTLLSIGADPNVADSLKTYPLYYAAELGHYELVKILMEYCADPDAKSAKVISETPDATPDAYLSTPLLIAAALGYEKIVELMSHRCSVGNLKDAKKLANKYDRTDVEEYLRKLLYQKSRNTSNKRKSTEIATEKTVKISE